MKRLLAAAILFACLLPTAANAKVLHHRLPWCGIYMNSYFGFSDRSLWLAANWARVGSDAGGPGEGVVVVWRHHVGVIVGRAANGEWLVHSGNDGGAVRTRPRSLRGAIAFRHVGGGASHNLHALQQEAPAGRHKNLVSLAVEGRHRAALKKPGAEALVASGEFSLAASFAPPTELTHKVVRHKRKAVLQRERVLFGSAAYAVVVGHSDEGISAWASHDFSIFSSTAAGTSYVMKPASHFRHLRKRR